MVSIKRAVLIVFALVLVLAGLAYINRVALVLALAKYRTDAVPVAPFREVNWSMGPDAPLQLEEERPPSIILIVADDLGYNDISTFGGGVADGRVPTPHIDELAAAGAVFTQSYSGAGTCAPFRAMLMTGRYPTRTGFEFTPTPPGMARIVNMVRESIPSNLPPGYFDPAVDEARMLFLCVWLGSPGSASLSGRGPVNLGVCGRFNDPNGKVVSPAGRKQNARAARCQVKALLARITDRPRAWHAGAASMPLAQRWKEYA